MGKKTKKKGNVMGFQTCEICGNDIRVYSKWPIKKCYFCGWPNVIKKSEIHKEAM